MKKKIIVTVSILMALTAAGIGGYAVFSNNTSEEVPVKVEVIKRANIVSSISATGVIQERNRRDLYIDASLKVKKMHCKLGEKVKKGQVLAELMTDSIKMQVQEAKLNYAIEKNNLEHLNEKLKNSLKDTQSLSDSISLENNITAAKADLERKQLEYDNVKTALATNQTLYNEHAIAKKQLEDAQRDEEIALIDLEVAKTTYENAQSNYAKLMNGQQQQVQQQINIQSNKVALAELKIEQLKSSLKEVDLESGKILAPIDGYIGSLGITEGGFSKTDKAAISIVDLEELTVNAKILENDVKNVKAGDPVIITGDAIGTEKYQGTVQNISVVAIKQQVNSMEQTVIDVGILVTSKQTNLRPGFNVDVKIETGNMQGVLSVPSEAVKEDKESNRYVYIVDQGKAKKVLLDTEIQSDTALGIKELPGIIGEKSKVIYNSEGILSEGTPVKVIQEK